MADSRKGADRTHAADSEMVTTRSRDKPLPPDSADQGVQVGVREAGSAEAGAAAVGAGAGAARKEDRKGLPPFGARNA